MWMITPAPCFSIQGSSPRSTRTALNRLLFSACCHSSSVRKAKPPPGAEDPPTLWIRISTPARRSRTPLTTFSTPSAVLRSASTNSSGWRRPWGADRDVVITFAPAPLRRSTIFAYTSRATSHECAFGSELGFDGSGHLCTSTAPLLAAEHRGERRAEREGSSLGFVDTRFGHLGRAS